MFINNILYPDLYFNSDIYYPYNNYEQIENIVNTENIFDEFYVKKLNK